jgi:hypothetical protein
MCYIRDPCRDVITETTLEVSAVEESPLLEAVTRERVKTRQTKKTAHVL